MMQRAALYLLPLLLLSGCAAPVLMGAAAAGAVVVAHDERNAATIAADEALELKAVNLARSQPALSDAHINITSINGIVLMSGEAPQQNALAELQSSIAKLEKAREVRNEVVIAPASTMESRSQDSWITTKLKSRLVAERDIRANRFKVVTEQQTVYLLGMVSKREGFVAATIARDIRGVKRVVKMFEYLD